MTKTSNAKQGTKKVSNSQFKIALSPQRIVESGLSIAGNSRVDEVSIRKIADELDVTPMAIYRHFSDKEELLAAMLDEFIIQADVLPHETLAWQAWLRHFGSSMYKALCLAPSWIPLFGGLQLKPGALAVMEAYMSRMIDAGFSREQAARGFFGLLQNLIGAATLYNAFSGVNNSTNPLSDLDPIKHIHVTASLTEIATAMTGDLMRNGLDLLIEGLQVELESLAKLTSHR